MRKKTSIIVLIIIGIIPLIMNESLGHSAYYRDAFFYADKVVAEQILDYGSVPLNPDAQVSDADLRYWGKITSRHSQPVLPIFMVIGNLVTGLPLYVFHSHIPLYFILGGFYYIISKNFASAKTSILVGIIGATITNNPMNSGGRLINKILLLFLIWSIIYCFTHKDFHRVSSVFVPTSLIALLFLYPRRFIQGATLVLLTSISLSIMRRRKLLIGSCVSIVGTWVILAVPFNVYSYYLITVFSKLSSLGGNVSSDVSPNRVLSTPNYNLLPIVPLFLLGVIGGIVVIAGLVKYRTGESEIRLKQVPLFLWGISITSLVFMQFAVGSSWLSGRYVSTSLPLIVIAASVGVKAIDKKSGFNLAKGLLGIIVILSLVSYGLVASSAWVNIHTYSNEDVATAQWASSYSQSEIRSDMAGSALVVPKSEATYPLNKENMNETFYDINVKEPRHREIFIFHTGMYQDGLYLPPYPREPVSYRWFESTTASKNIVYSNRKSKIVWASPRRSVTD
ncbi:hypothetical protein ACODNH_18935 [Haloarcula sp. NS06]|uniref:hypothetical protein n=1 Tax=Haloarcula sp. NS06 TaxID=3409688 RepID=UPI003DA6ECA7